MGRSFIDIILDCFLVVAILIPEVMMLNAFIAYSDNIPFWLFVSGLMILLISFIIYIKENKHKVKIYIIFTIKPKIRKFILKRL